MAGSQITRNLPDNQYLAAVNANAPTAVNPFATILDLAGLDQNWATADLNAVANRSHTIAAANKVNVTWADGAGTTVLYGQGANTLGFGENGVGTYIVTPGNDAYAAVYEFGGESYIDYQVSDFAVGAASGLFVGPWAGAGHAYSFMYYTADGVSFTGFQADEFGERILSQAGGLSPVAMNATDRVMFLNGSGASGYIGVATPADFAAWLPTLYGGNSTIGSGRVATLTDTLEFRSGLVRFNTTASVLGSTNARNVISNYSDATGDIFSNAIFSVTHTPTVNGSGRATGVYGYVNKSGNFNSLEVQGAKGDVLITGSGNVTNSRGVLAQIVNNGTGTYTSVFALSANSQTSAGTASEIGGVLIRREQTAVGSIVGSMYGVKIETPTNTGGTVTNTYDIYAADNTIATNNWGLYILGAAKVNHLAGNTSIGTTLNAAKLNVRGSGTTTGLMFLGEDQSGVDRFIINDNGQTGIRAGGAASINASFGHFWAAGAYTNGFGFYSYSGTTTTINVQHTGAGANPFIIDAGFQGAPTGTATAIRSAATVTGPTTSIAVYGNARNGSSYSIGVDGLIPGGASITSSQYVAAVRGQATANVDSVSYGTYGYSAYNNNALTYTKDMIGALGWGAGATGGVGSTGKIVGGKFMTSGTTGTGDRIALWVPSTGNNGTVVIGADAVSANASLVEVTGDVETIGNSYGHVVTDRTNGNRYRIYTDGGAVQTELA